MHRRPAQAAAIAAALILSAPAAPAALQPGASATAAAAPGSAQRRAILDALRPAVQARFGPNVEFLVHRIQVRQGWAVVMADPQRRGGGRIDPRRYYSADDLEFMDGITVTAVLRFRGGRWHHVDHAIGATDVWYCGDVLPAAIRASFGC
jgi:hypothetical protein